MSMEREKSGWKIFQLFFFLFYNQLFVPISHRKAATGLIHACTNGGVIVVVLCIINQKTAMATAEDPHALFIIHASFAVKLEVPEKLKMVAQNVIASSSGYCKTGAELIVQSKPREVFKWVTSTWLPCSSTCGGGVRTRRVECYSVIEDTSTPDYPVYDDKCSNQDMPAKQEPCNLQACAGGQNYSPQIRNPSTHNWLVIILVLLGLVAVCAVVFAGYIFYVRRSSSSQHGHVYIMLEGYT